MRRQARIVLTGGPGAGKTTAADMIGREFPGEVVVLEETATMLFEGGFPRDGSATVRRACQRAIYAAQVELEEAVAARNPGRVLLCDRGAVDGCVYWPEGPAAFFAALGTSLARELARYDAVIFFESAAVAGADLDRRNPFRVETTAEAARLDALLRATWSAHPRFRLVPHHPSFFAKVGAGLEAFRAVLEEVRPPVAAGREEGGIREP